MNHPVSISLVTTCKGRLAYLKESLPTWLALDYPNFDIIVVDYDCPDSTADFIKRNKDTFLDSSKAKDIQVVKVEDKPFFNLNDARNRGVSHSNAELVFMVDADIHLKDKSVLKKMNRGYHRGMVFFSSLPVLNSRYFEAVTFYRLQYNQEITVPAVLPLISHSVGSTGTVCFCKDLWDACGRYDPEINKLGYGCDDMEFYLRYLNCYFYDFYLMSRGESRPGSLDDVLARFYTFRAGTFIDVENPEEEKDRFYPVKKNKSASASFAFINRFFVAFAWEAPFESQSRELIKADLPWFDFWYGQMLYEQKRVAESRDYFEKLLRRNSIEPGFRATAYFFLGEIAAFQGRMEEGLFYYMKSLDHALPKRKKSLKDCYFIASLYKRLGNFKLARKWFSKILLSGKGKDLQRGIRCHMEKMEAGEKSRRVNDE